MLVALIAATLAFGATSGEARSEIASLHAAPVAVIFMYHHVSSRVAAGPYGRALTLQPAEFAHQLRWLRSHGCETVTVNTIVADVSAGALRGCEVALTFDDGYADGATEAQPLLRDAGDTATFYVSSGFVGAAGHLSAAQLRGLVDDGVQIGAHTVHHVDLRTRSQADAQKEIDGSRSALIRWSGAEVDSFAYPAGQYDAGIERLVRGAGFRTAATTQPGLLSSRGVAVDPYALPRYRIERDSGTALIQRIIGPATRQGMSPKELQTIARERIEGNDRGLAERIGAALLNASYPEQLLKVRVLRAHDATVVGLMLSGVKLHAAVSRSQFEADVGGMIERAFDARPDIAEVDVWAVSPLLVQPADDVSGDYTPPTTRTVFSAAVTRRARDSAVSRTRMLGTMYWGDDFLKSASAR